ncbi:hypothetical protein APT14_23455, partial [Escherichia coli]
WLMMSLWDALRMNMMISYQELVRTFHSIFPSLYNLPDIGRYFRTYNNRSTKFIRIYTLMILL